MTVAEQVHYAINVEAPEGLILHGITEALEEFVFDVAKEGRDFWEAEAGRVLKTSRDLYQKSIGMIQTGKYSVTLQLMGSQLVIDIEEGKPKYDMSPLFLASPKIKRKAIPKAIADSMPKSAYTGQAKATRWMVIPLNLTGEIPNRDGGQPLVSPTFRMFTNTQPSNMWWHPGFPGMHIADTVMKELEDNIIPNNLSKFIDKAMS